MSHKQISGLLLVVTLLLIGLAILPAAAQSCSIRTDWPTYTIVRGDTLYRIARRYQISLTDLASANCIYSTSRIFAGQILRVPPGSGSGSAYGTVDIPATFQQYEKGFMIWRTDTGDVWVYVGSSGGGVMHFLTRSYGQLPENPVTEPTPSGKVRPIMGFGRVWGNFPNVRSALGWATNPERSFIMKYTPISPGAFYSTMPDGRTSVTSGSQTWSITTSPVPTPISPTPSPTSVVSGNVDVRVSFQPFEHGFMIWRSDGGLIGVYQDQSGVGGIASFFPAVSYARLPDNPIFGTPSGRVRPIMGFGKVWGNFDWVRTALGWAISGEQSYVASFRGLQTSPTSYFSLPDGRIVYLSLNMFWSYGSNTPAPTATPVSPVTQVTINAAYQLFENGFMLWRADTGRIDLFTKSYVAGYNLDQYQSLPDNPVTDQPPAGRFKPISGFGRVWGNFAETRSQLGWGLAQEQGYRATFKTDTASNVICVNLPDGRNVSYPHFVGNRSWTWQYEGSC